MIAGVQRSLEISLFAVMALLAGCSKNKPAAPDHPRLTPNARMQDVEFHSTALDRTMQYRVVLPAEVSANQKLPVVYLLHGGGGNFRNWSNYTDVARFAESGLILVMPEGDESYYTNSATRAQDRYEDYIVHDLISDVESRLPAAIGRGNRAIVGVSMGGYGAVKLALRHPELYSFVGGLSSAVDVPTRPFSLKRIGQWQHHRSIFGASGGQVQRENDPFVLVLSASPQQTPYFFLTCGDQEGLLPANRKLAALLDQRHIAHEFHVVQGGHNWTQWNQQLASCFESLAARIKPREQR